MYHALASNIMIVIAYIARERSNTREFFGVLLLEDLEIVLCAYVKGAYRGGYAMEKEMLFISLYYD